MGFIGSGRHRRPTQTERAVAAAGVAGVGIALPLLTATGAHAVAPTTWDAVAQCASAGNWSKDTGNGAYGGLQIDLRSWVAYGGDAYAAEPDHATKEQQIAVAERILADRGASVWGSCATGAGLTGEGRATAQPSAPATTTPSAPATTGTPSAPVTTTPDVPTQRGSAAPVFPGMQGLDAATGVYWYQANGTWYWTTSQQVYEQNTGTASPAPTTGTPAPGSATPAPTTTTTPAPGTPAPGTTTDTPGTGTGTTTTAPGTGTGTGTTGTTPGAPIGDPTAATGTPTTTDGTALPAPATAPDTTSYTVAPGDTLSGISDTHKLGGWKHLYDQNQSTVGDNPDLIHPGQVLDIQ
ncbi:transglycosylase family protein [Kitasatospora paranensis]|uniref:Transglycosylase family protein n=1 Tax=Kitasatospora paranensis TaxID=258053 RepID=A0ABW2G0Z1_9ACTN